MAVIPFLRDTFDKVSPLIPGYIAPPESKPTAQSKLDRIAKLDPSVPDDRTLLNQYIDDPDTAVAQAAIAKLKSAKAEAGKESQTAAAKVNRVVEPITRPFVERGKAVAATIANTPAVALPTVPVTAGIAAVTGKPVGIEAKLGPTLGDVGNVALKAAEAPMRAVGMAREAVVGGGNVPGKEKLLQPAITATQESILEGFRKRVATAKANGLDPAEVQFTHSEAAALLGADIVGTIFSDPLTALPGLLSTAAKTKRGAEALEMLRKLEVDRIIAKLKPDSGLAGNRGGGSTAMVEALRKDATLASTGAPGSLGNKAKTGVQKLLGKDKPVAQKIREEQEAWLPVSVGINPMEAPISTRVQELSKELIKVRGDATTGGGYAKDWAETGIRDNIEKSIPITNEELASVIAKVGSPGIVQDFKTIAKTSGSVLEGRAVAADKAVLDQSKRMTDLQDKVQKNLRKFEETKGELSVLARRMEATAKTAEQRAALTEFRALQKNLMDESMNLMDDVAIAEIEAKLALMERQIPKGALQQDLQTAKKALMQQLVEHRQLQSSLRTARMESMPTVEPVTGVQQAAQSMQYDKKLAKGRDASQAASRAQRELTDLEFTDPTQGLAPGASDTRLQEAVKRIEQDFAGTRVTDMEVPMARSVQEILAQMVKPGLSASDLRNLVQKLYQQIPSKYWSDRPSAPPMIRGAMAAAEEANRVIKSKVPAGMATSYDKAQKAIQARTEARRNLMEALDLPPSSVSEMTAKELEREMQTRFDAILEKTPTKAALDRIYGALQAYDKTYGTKMAESLNAATQGVSAFGARETQAGNVKPVGFDAAGMASTAAGQLATRIGESATTTLGALALGMPGWAALTSGALAGVARPTWKMVRPYLLPAGTLSDKEIYSSLRMQDAAGKILRSLGTGSASAAKDAYLAFGESGTQEDLQQLLKRADTQGNAEILFDLLWDSSKRSEAGKKIGGVMQGIADFGASAEKALDKTGEAIKDPMAAMGDAARATAQAADSTLSQAIQAYTPMWEHLEGGINWGTEGDKTNPPLVVDGIQVPKAVGGIHFDTMRGLSKDKAKWEPLMAKLQLDAGTTWDEAMQILDPSDAPLVLEYLAKDKGLDKVMLQHASPELAAMIQDYYFYGSGDWVNALRKVAESVGADSSGPPDEVANDIVMAVDGDKEAEAKAVVGLLKARKGDEQTGRRIKRLDDWVNTAWKNTKNEILREMLKDANISADVGLMTVNPKLSVEPAK